MRVASGEDPTPECRETRRSCLFPFDNRVLRPARARARRSRLSPASRRRPVAVAHRGAAAPGPGTRHTARGPTGQRALLQKHTQNYIGLLTHDENINTALRPCRIAGARGIVRRAVSREDGGQRADLSESVRVPGRASAVRVTGRAGSTRTPACTESKRLDTIHPSPSDKPQQRARPLAYVRAAVHALPRSLPGPELGSVTSRSSRAA